MTNEHELLIKIARTRIALQHTYIDYMRHLLSQGADVDENVCDLLIKGTKELENLMLAISLLTQSDNTSK